MEIMDSPKYQQEPQNNFGSRKVLIRVIMFSLLVCGMMYFNVMSFLPLYTQKNFGEDKINTTMITICMSMFEVAGIICSPISTCLMGKMGHKRALILGLSLCGISTFGLGVLEYTPQTEWQMFYYSCSICRFW